MGATIIPHDFDLGKRLQNSIHFEKVAVQEHFAVNYFQAPMPMSPGILHLSSSFVNRIEWNVHGTSVF